MTNSKHQNIAAKRSVLWPSKYAKIIKVKSKYLLKAYNKRIRTVQCGYMQYRINTKT